MDRRLNGYDKDGFTTSSELLGPFRVPNGPDGVVRTLRQAGTRSDTDFVFDRDRVTVNGDRPGRAHPHAGQTAHALIGVYFKPQ